MPRAQPPACFWEPSAELGALHRGQEDPACSCPRPLFLRRSAPPVQRARVWLRRPEFPSRSIPASAAGPGGPGSSSEVLALLGRDPRSPQVQRHHPDQRLRLPAVCLRVFHGTSPAAVPRGCFFGSSLCSESAPWLRPGARLSKSSGGAARTGRRGSPWGLRMKRGRQICSQSIIGLGFAGTVSARRCTPLPERRFLVPGAPAPARPPACMLLGRQLHPPEVSAFLQQGLTQP